MEPRAFCLLSKYSANKLYPYPVVVFETRFPVDHPGLELLPQSLKCWDDSILVRYS